MTQEEMLDLWVQGVAIHNDEDGQCVPDFSCCGGTPAAQEDKEAFSKAYKECDSETCMQFMDKFMRAAYPNDYSDDEFESITPENNETRH